MTTTAKEKGFTLIELLVVLVLLSLMATLTVYALSKAEKKHTIRTTTKQVVLLLKEARAKAIMRQEPVTLKKAEDEPVILVSAHSVGILKRFSPPDNIVVEMEPLVFFPTGSSSGGKIEISDQQRHYIIEVDEVTGLATIKRQ